MLPIQHRLADGVSLHPGDRRRRGDVADDAGSGTDGFADSPLEGDGFEPSVPRLGDLSYHAGSRLRDEILGPENDRCAVGRAFGSAIPGGTVNSFGRQRANCVIDPPSFASLGASSKVASIAPSNTQAAPASPPARAVSQIHDRNGCCRSFDRCSRLS
jgi:hypothetical protein